MVIIIIFTFYFSLNHYFIRTLSIVSVVFILSTLRIYIFKTEYIQCIIECSVTEPI